LGSGKRGFEVPHPVCDGFTPGFGEPLVFGWILVFVVLLGVGYVGLGIVEGLGQVAMGWVVVRRLCVLGLENVLEKRGCWLEENILVDMFPHIF
jgi:hypothetical protein